MPPISVLLIGASGAFGQPLLQEFIRQKPSFHRIAVLAANEEKATKFADVREQGIEVVIGSFLEATSYAGEPTFNPSSLENPLSLPSQLTRACDFVQALHMSSQQWATPSWDSSPQ